MTISSKNLRASSKELEQREEKILNLLSQEESTAPDMAVQLGLTYPQMLLLLARLQEKNAIERVPGRIDRKIKYRLSGPYSRVDAFFIEPIAYLSDSYETDIRTVHINDEVYISFEDTVSFLENHSDPEHLVGELCGAAKDSVHIGFHRDYFNK